MKTRLAVLLLIVSALSLALWLGIARGARVVARGEPGSGVTYVKPESDTSRNRPPVRPPSRRGKQTTTPAITSFILTQPQPCSDSVHYSAVVTDTAGTDGLEWRIVFSDGGAITASGAISGTYSLQDPSYPGVLSATLTISDTAGAAVTRESNPIDVNQPPVMGSFTVAQDAGCSPVIEYRGTVDDADGEDILSWEVLFSDGGRVEGNGGIVSGSYTLTDAQYCGTITATLVVSDAAGCLIVAQDAMDVNRPPTINSFEISQPDACADSVHYQAVLQDCDAGDSLTWAIVFSDGGTEVGVGPIASGTYALQDSGFAGVLTATLTVTDARGCRATASSNALDISQPPVIDTFTLAQPDACALQVHAQATLSDPDVPTGGNLTWEILASNGERRTGNGTTIQVTLPTEILGDPAFCSVLSATLTITDGSGCTAQASSNVVDVNQPPAVQAFALTQPSACTSVLSYTGTLADPDGTSGLAWHLSFSDGGHISGSGPTVAGTYEPADATFCGTIAGTLTVTDVAGCTASATDSVDLNLPPHIDALTIAQQSSCTDIISYAATALDCDGAEALHWLLTFSDGGRISGTGGLLEGSYTLANPGYAGVVTATLVVTDSAGCTAQGGSSAVDVNQTPSVAAFDISQPDGCTGSLAYAATLADADGAADLAWTLSFGDGGSVTGTGGVLSGNYGLQDPAFCDVLTATLTVRDRANCTATTTRMIDVNRPPAIVSVAIAQPNACADTLHYEAVITDCDGLDTLTWALDFSDGGVITGTGAPTAGVYTLRNWTYSGTISATLTITDSAGCRSVMSSNVIDLNQPPQIEAFAIAQPDRCTSLVHVSGNAADADGDPVNWRIDFTDGGRLTGTGVITGTYLLQSPVYCGLLQAEFTVEDQAGCKAWKDSNVLDINQTPRITALTLAQPDLASDEIAYTADVTDCDGTASLAWKLEFSDGGVRTGNGSTISGTYTLQDPAFCGVISATLTVTDAAGCHISTISNAVNVNQPSRIESFVLAQPDACSDAIHYTAVLTDCDGDAVHWGIKFSDGGSLTGQGVVSGTYTLLNPSFGGDLIATLTVTDAHDCASVKSSNTLDVFQPPVASSLTLNRANPASGAIDVQASWTDVDGLTGMTWRVDFFDGGSIQGASNSGAASGTYTLAEPSYCGPISATLTVTDAQGCSGQYATVYSLPERLRMEIDDLDDPVPASTLIRYRIDVTNTSQVAADSILLHAVLPTMTHWVSMPANAGWTYDEATRGITRTVQGLGSNMAAHVELVLGTEMDARGTVRLQVQAQWGCARTEASEDTNLSDPPPATATPTATATHTPTTTPTNTPTPTPTATATPRPQGRISVFVWNDLDGNGVYDRSELALAGAVIAVYSQEGTARGLLAGADLPIATCTTQADGRCTFDLPFGLYTVEEVDPPGYASTTGNRVTVQVVAAQETIVSFGDRLISNVWLPIIGRG